MIDPEHAKQLMVQSRAKQGLPPTVTDEATLERVATLLLAKMPRRRDEKRAAS